MHYNFQACLSFFFPLQEMIDKCLICPCIEVFVGLNKTTELSRAGRVRECEDLGAQRKVSHKGEGGAAGAGGGGGGGGHEAGKSPGASNSDYRQKQRGHHSAAPQMHVLYTSHPSTIPSIWLILVLLFY